jgi:SNF2 family DNA or RNA helicase
MDEALRPGAIVQGDYWPEPVRVLTVRPLPSTVVLEAIGTQTSRYYSSALSQSDIAQLTILVGQDRDCSGRGEAFFLAIEAQRIRLAHQFDPLLAVNVSQIDPLPHQIEAVYHHMLRTPRIRFLLADDPGAGKTIMAGLLIKELKYRGLAQRVLIVVPGHLKEQWLRELKERFDETFAVIDRAAWTTPSDATSGRSSHRSSPRWTLRSRTMC